MLESFLAHLVHVDEEGVGLHSIGRGVIDLAREVELHSVGEVSTVGQFEAENGVTRLREGVKHCGTGTGTRVWLNVGVCGAEELFGPLDGEVLGDIYKFASAVVALSGVTLGILVGQDAALGFKDCVRNKVLTGNHFQCSTLATQFLVEDILDFWINLRQCGAKHVEW